MAGQRGVPWAGDSDSMELSTAQTWPMGPMQTGPRKARVGSVLAPQQGSPALGLIHPWGIGTDCPQCVLSSGAAQVSLLKPSCLSLFLGTLNE